MKKISLFLVAVMLLLSLAACGKDGATAGKGQMNNGEKVWTVKTATYTYPTGFETVSYTAELKDDTFIMNNLRELKKGEVDRNSMIFEFDSNGITKVIEEEQDFGEDTQRGEEMTITYDEATSTLTKLSVENGKESSKEVYVIAWDDEGRISSYDQTNYYFEYDGEGNLVEDSKYEYKYTYSYGNDSYTITQDEVRETYVDGDGVEAIKRTVTTVPYDAKGDIKTVISYVELDGKTPLYTGSDDEKKVDEVIISNWWGYEVSHVYNYSDGSWKNVGSDQYTFDNEGKIVKVTNEEDQISIDFTYDNNGNLTKIQRSDEGQITTIEFEWMQIPARLDSQLGMMSGSPHWSVAEWIDNYVDFNWDGRLTVRTYKLSDFLSYVK